MLKVTLRYTDCLQDGRRVFQIIANHNVIILKTKPAIFSIYPKVIILVDSIKSLNALVSDLNSKCSYEVSVVKTKVVKEK